MRLAAALLVISGCVSPEPHEPPYSPGYTLRVEIDPSHATVVLEGTTGLTLAADFTSFSEAVASFAVAARVSFDGMTRHEIIAPGYCIALARAHGRDIGVVYSEDLVLSVTSGLYLRPIEAHCYGSGAVLHQGH